MALGYNERRSPYTSYSIYLRGTTAHVPQRPESLLEGHCVASLKPEPEGPGLEVLKG